MSDPVAIAKVKHTVLCQTDGCRLALCEITAKREYIPVHARPVLRLHAGRTYVRLECPGCQKARVVEVR